ncbi:hypothetical protein [Methylobacterium sp. 22177]|uniref:hypothetical protein n=1 Tax=Methylobacterium sp. 22177 TaxID=3453885 RepID=UPI003F878FFD
MSQSAGHGFDHDPSSWGQKLWRAFCDFAWIGVLFVFLWIESKHFTHGVKDAAEVARDLLSAETLSTVSLLALIQPTATCFLSAKGAQHTTSSLLKHKVVREMVVAACAGASALAILFSILFAIYWAALSFEYFFGVAMVWTACAIICAAMWIVGRFVSSYSPKNKH